MRRGLDEVRTWTVEVAITGKGNVDIPVSAPR